MSEPSRAVLLPIWQDPGTDPHLRKAAFVIWSATDGKDDLALLRQIGATDVLGKLALRQRLKRGDQTAIPLLLEKLHADPKSDWWWLGRYVWSAELTMALDESLAVRGNDLEDLGRLSMADWILAELLMRLPAEVAEPILLKHWADLRVSPFYVQAALYIATPPLRRVAKDAIEAAPDPKKMLQDIDHHFGIKVEGHLGVVRKEQIESVVPYISLLDTLPILHFWGACNERGWFDLRREHFDPLITDGREAEYVHKQSTFAAFDRMAADQPRWSDLWVEGFLKTGISRQALVALLDEWLVNRRSTPAIELVADVLIQIGQRSGLRVLAGRGNRTR